MPNTDLQQASRPKRALALLSGGLDSLLAVRVIQEQGIEVEGVNFYTGFCVEGHTQALRKTDKTKRHSALHSAQQLGIKLHIVDISEAYKEVVLRPKYGYGKHANPCTDCKIFMLKQAKLMLEKAHEMVKTEGFDFIITGEVIGQRPNSQLKKKMPIIAEESQTEDILLRPLCAKKLEPTLPERMGWVDRDKLFDFYGRNRSPQIELAQHYGFEDYAQPAGGCCFLTDDSYTKKLRDLWQSRGQRDYEMDDIILLKVGRHIRPAAHFKLIISREEGETHYLEGYRDRFLSMKAANTGGALMLIDGSPTEDDLKLAAQICARYSKAKFDPQVAVDLKRPGDPLIQRYQVQPFGIDDMPAEWILQ